MRGKYYICQGIRFGLQRIKWHNLSFCQHAGSEAWEAELQCLLSVSPGSWKERSHWPCTTVIADLWHKVPLLLVICTIWIRSASLSESYLGAKTCFQQGREGPRKTICAYSSLPLFLSGMDAMVFPFDLEIGEACWSRINVYLGYGTH